MGKLREVTTRPTTPGAASGEADRTMPASRRIANHLRQAIESGDLRPGDRLPSERALAAEHDVARNTAREAVRLLAEQGLVSAEHGRGVFVRERTPLIRFGQQRYSRSLREQTGLSPYRAEVQAQGRTPRVDCVSITKVPAPDFVALRLGLDHGAADVVRRENWYYADDRLVQIGTTYSPWAVVEGTPIADSANLGPGSLYARFEETGNSLSKIREEVRARMPTPAEVDLLRPPEGAPLFDLIHTGFNAEGNPFEVTHFIMRSDLSGLDYEIPIVN